ncbi:hypothetical protein NW767_002861 [Fusarium falciforme]|uniref:Uncharacterized protein n=1 Tax=Fusarium falciforme TaxID=195108 RepID=A0A9W8RA41_9HYPO|nr:hypothetical protein NW755_004676 [Fusarium falciforme]KAJ4206573.1 hypothetical protein NW767_002861 [Fusarium falciforme]
MMSDRMLFNGINQAPPYGSFKRGTHNATESNRQSKHPSSPAASIFRGRLCHSRLSPAPFVRQSSSFNLSGMMIDGAWHGFTLDPWVAKQPPNPALFPIVPRFV